MSDLNVNTTAKSQSPWAQAWRRFRGNYAALAGLIVLSIIIFAAIFGPSIYGVDPFEMVWSPFSPPGVDGFILGTDYLGRDLLAAIINGAGTIDEDGS